MRKNPQEDDILLHYEYNKVMLIKEGDGYRLPAFRDLKGEEDAVESVSYLFSIDSKGYYLADTFQMPEFGGFVMEGLQIFRSFEPMEDGFAGIRGARFTVGERAAGFAAAAGEKCSGRERAFYGMLCVRPYRISQDQSGSDRGDPGMGIGCLCPGMPGGLTVIML